ncbi:MAG: NADH-quinone oxidoreductase subunit NuoH [Deltaproteobacteria bacterium]|nr:NADH-quinone oxidoreductase subunit NuoH [Deltaproteobacteria bacterium]
MQELFDKTVIAGWLGQNPATWAYTHYLYAAGMLLIGLVVGACAAVYAGLCTWAERRWAGRFQSRIGPNRNGPAGILQWIADAVKLLFKEDTIPDGADRPLFRLAPYFVFAGFLMTFAALPLSPKWIVADLDVGIFYILAITALTVVGILMSGWASNSKWALFGGIRAAAQVVSYEIPAGMSLLIPVLMAGSLSTNGIIAAQGGAADAPWYLAGGLPWNWFVFANPMAFVAFFIFLTSSLAEGNRTPFDLPEAESELVAGFNTEYSGIRFAVFFLTEFGNLYVMSALATILFLGGWQIPFLPSAQIASSWGWELLAAGIFLLKVLGMTTVVMWLRWTLPRIRVDQMMSLCWKYFVPISMVLLVLTAASQWLLSGVDASVISFARVVFFGVAFVVPSWLFIKRMFRNIRMVGDRVDLSGW